MRSTIFLLTFLLAGALARPNEGQSRSLQKRSMENSLQEVMAEEEASAARRRRSSEDNGKEDERAKGDSISSDPTVAEFVQRMKKLLSQFGLNDIKDLPEAIANFNSASMMKSIEKILNSVTSADIRRYIQEVNPIRTFIFNIPLIGTFAKLLRDMLSIPGEIGETALDGVTDTLRIAGSYISSLI